MRIIAQQRNSVDIFIRAPYSVQSCEFYSTVSSKTLTLFLTKKKYTPVNIFQLINKMKLIQNIHMWGVHFVNMHLSFNESLLYIHNVLHITTIITIEQDTRLNTRCSPFNIQHTIYRHSCFVLSSAALNAVLHIFNSSPRPRALATWATKVSSTHIPAGRACNVPRIPIPQVYGRLS